MHLRVDHYSVMSRVVSSAFLKSIHEFLPFQKTSMPGDNPVHSPSCLPNGVIKNSCLGADYSLADLALKDFEHVTLEEESCLGKIDGEIAINMRIGKMDEFHRLGPIRDGFSVLDCLNLGLQLD